MKKQRKPRTEEQLNKERIAAAERRRQKGAPLREYRPYMILKPIIWNESAEDKAEVEKIIAMGVK